MTASFKRYVAIGDSTTEGLDDPDDRGGYRGWANRLAERLASQQGSILYANLGIRGRTTRQILDEQLAIAVSMKPDLATVVSGTNDLMGRTFDVEAVVHDIEMMQRALIDTGATVLTFTLPDLTPVMPLARVIRSRVSALAEGIRETCQRSGAILCDLAAYDVATDPRLWSDDRLHANSAGHARIAEALAYHLGLPNTDRSWSVPLPGRKVPTLAGMLQAEAAWSRRYFFPWLWRHARGRSSGDGVTAKRPELLPFPA
ncbi:MAG: SGNH/GDSL hydrolase family protein [Acidobacteriota bacterium]